MKLSQVAVAITGGVLALAGGLSLFKSTNRKQTRIRAICGYVGLAVLGASFFMYKNPDD